MTDMSETPETADTGPAMRRDTREAIMSTLMDAHGAVDALGTILIREAEADNGEGHDGKLWLVGQIHEALNRAANMVEAAGPNRVN